MKRIQKRSSAALLLACVLLLCSAVFLIRLAAKGDEWASYTANASVFTTNGILSCGTVTDRNGVLLAKSENGEVTYAGDETLRLASLHAVGDYRGYCSGAIQMYANRLTGYSMFLGTSSGEGGTIALTLDAELQKTAWSALKNRNGCVLVINYETGEILAMVSSPSYDPYGKPDESIDGIYMNRALQGVYTPGSVWKTVTLCAALENIPDIYERSFVCTGRADVAGGRLTCAAAHGKQTVQQAFANSCNCTFGSLALELGGDTLKSYADKLGLTSTHSLDGISTAAGHFDAVTDSESCLAWSGVGQHTDQINPYALLRYLAAVARGGTVVEPTLLLGNRNGTVSLLNQETAGAIADIMSYTFTTRYAPGGAFPNLDLGAKTGTAELGDGTSHSWFVGYCRSGPPLCFAVCIERGGEGFSNAAPAANKVLQRALELYGE